MKCSRTENFKLLSNAPIMKSFFFFLIILIAALERIMVLAFDIGQPPGSLGYARFYDIGVLRSAE